MDGKALFGVVVRAIGLLLAVYGIRDSLQVFFSYEGITGLDFNDLAIILFPIVAGVLLFFGAETIVKAAYRN